MFLEKIYHNNLNIMILKITNPREAIIESFNTPVLYKNYILLKGTRVVRFK